MKGLYKSRYRTEMGILCMFGNVHAHSEWVLVDGLWFGYLCSVSHTYFVPFFEWNVGWGCDYLPKKYNLKKENGCGLMYHISDW